MTIMTFSKTFLLQIAYEYQLSLEQQEVFFRKMGEEKAYDDIAKILGISKIACIQRMGAVYKKFGIEGDTRGKEYQLRLILNDKYTDFFDENQESTFDSFGNKTIFADNIILGNPRLKEELNELIEVEQIPINNYSTNFNSVSSNKIENFTFNDWVRDLREKLYKGQGLNYVQYILQEISLQLPTLIERVAATSRRTELELTFDLLNKLESLIKIEPYISWEDFFNTIANGLKLDNWQPTESILESSRSLNKFKVGLSRCKLIKINETLSIILLVELQPKNNENINFSDPIIGIDESLELQIEVRPDKDKKKLPDKLQLKILDRNNKTLTQQELAGQIFTKFKIFCQLGEELSIILSLKQWTIIEKLIIPN